MLWDLIAELIEVVASVLAGTLDGDQATLGHLAERKDDDSIFGLRDDHQILKLERARWLVMMPAS